MGKLFYSSLFIEMTVSILSFLMIFSTNDWLNTSGLRSFFSILFYRDIIDLVLSISAAFVMVVYRNNQLKIFPSIATFILIISLSVSWFVLFPLWISPNKFLTRYTPLIQKSIKDRKNIELTIRYKCCGYETVDQFRGQKCKSRNLPCLKAFSNAVQPIAKGKIMITFFLYSFQALSVYIMWLVHASGEKIDDEEEDDIDGEESRLLTAKKQAPKAVDTCPKKDSEEDIIL